MHKLLNNSRFYILSLSVLFSLIVIAYLRIEITSDQLYYIRLQQVFGLAAVVLLYGAVILTPISQLLGKRTWLSRLLFARRAIGVSAFYFALLHALIALEQLDWLNGLSVLSGRFLLSFILGATGLLVLFALAITSFDRAVKALTWKRWKLLQRFVYLAGVVIIIHVWLIGTHVDEQPVQLISYAALGLLFALESRRIGAYLARLLKSNTSEQWLITVAVFIIMASALIVLPTLAKSYHGQHEQRASQVQVEATP